MVTIDKEASIEAIRAGERIFQAFGSTRLLGFGMLILGVYFVVSGEKSSPELLIMGLWVVAIGFGLLVVSYILRPHDSKKKKEDSKGSPSA